MDNKQQLLEKDLAATLSKHNAVLFAALSVTEQGIIPVVKANFISPIDLSETSKNIPNVSQTGEVFNPLDDNEQAIQDIIEANSAKGIDTKMSDVSD